MITCSDFEKFIFDHKELIKDNRKEGDNDNDGPVGFKGMWPVVIWVKKKLRFILQIGIDEEKKHFT